ncbi:MAG: cell wall hydrolase [Roseburia sp.]
MRLRNKVIECAIVAVAMTAVTAVTAIVTPDYTAKEVTNENETEATESMVAGVFGDLEETEGNTAEVASIERSNAVVVSEAAPELTEEERWWSNKLLANVNEFLYIRSEADEASAIEGKLYKGSAADIVEELDGWYHVTSGSVEGYVKSDYCVTGQEAYELSQSVCGTAATALVDGLRVRKSASNNAAVVGALTEGEKAVVDAEAPESYGWVAVIVNGCTGYVSASYVEVSPYVGEAVSIEEEQAAIKKQQEEEAARQAAQAAAAKQAAQTTSTTVTQNAPVAASVDDTTLLAAIIQCEAGGECYEGQVAVGAVVMNRVRSGSYPSTIYDVIYQKGQFTPAGSGKLASVLSSGVSSSCVQAAQEALNGTDNTGGALFFRRASSGHSGLVIGNHVFY